MNACELCGQSMVLADEFCDDCAFRLEMDYQHATCAACGHRRSDHKDAQMGALSNDGWLCHEDDHSCYVPTGLVEAYSSPSLRVISGGAS